MKTGVIYGLKAVGGEFVYVGQTTQRPLTRLARHLYHATHSGAESPIAIWLRSMDPDQILVAVLATAPADQLVDLEESWIHKLKTLTSDGGLNTRRGFKWDGGRPSAAAWMPASRMSSHGNHVQWHVNRGIVSPKCELCV